jgi:carboxylesterase
MIGAALAALAALAAGVRAGYPWLVERRAARRRRLGPDGVIVGAAPITLHRPGAPAVLLLHGGGDTPQALAALARFLHERGYTVRAPLMRSHGRSVSALGGASPEAWHADAATELAALRRDHPWVAVVGLSMGGAIAARLAADASSEHPLDALVLLAPYVDMPARIQQLARTTEYWRWALPYFPSGGDRSIHDAAAAESTLGHGILTPAALRAFYETMRAGAASLGGIRAPTLYVQSREDNRIPVSSAERAFGAVGARDKKLVWLEGTGHVITVDFGHEHVFELVAEWLDGHGGVSLREPDRRGSRRIP